MSFHVLKYAFMGLYSGTVFSVMMLKTRGFQDAEGWVWGLLYLASLCAVFVSVREKKIGSHVRRTPTAVLIVLFTLMTTLLVITANFAPGEYFSRTGYGKLMASVMDKKFFVVFPVVWAVFLVPSFLLLMGKGTDRVYDVFLRPLLAASALNVVSSMIFHHFVEKRGGCLAGITSGLGVFCAFAVFLWVLGPSLLVYLLFLRKKYGKIRRS